MNKETTKKLFNKKTPFVPARRERGQDDLGFASKLGRVACGASGIGHRARWSGVKGELRVGLFSLSPALTHSLTLVADIVLERRTLSSSR